jgi:hypothetical protein
MSRASINWEMSTRLQLNEPSVSEGYTIEPLRDLWLPKEELQKILSV